MRRTRTTYRAIITACSTVVALYGLAVYPRIDEEVSIRNTCVTALLGTGVFQPLHGGFSAGVTGTLYSLIMPTAVARASGGGGGGGGGGSGSCGSGSGQGQQQQEQPTATSGSSETSGSWQEAAERMKKAQVPARTVSNTPDNLTAHCLKKNRSTKNARCGTGSRSGSCRHAFDVYTTKASIIPFEGSGEGSCVTVKVAGTCGVCGRMGFKVGGSGESCTPKSGLGVDMDQSFSCRTVKDTTESEDAEADTEAQDTFQ
jgi:hypothetical protein